jgi:hypothetical protein
MSRSTAFPSASLLEGAGARQLSKSVHEPDAGTVTVRDSARTQQNQNVTAGGGSGAVPGPTIVSEHTYVPEASAAAPDAAQAKPGDGSGGALQAAVLSVVRGLVQALLQQQPEQWVVTQVRGRKHALLHLAGAVAFYALQTWRCIKGPFIRPHSAQDKMYLGYRVTCSWRCVRLTWWRWSAPARQSSHAS